MNILKTEAESKKIVMLLMNADNAEKKNPYKSIVAYLLRLTNEKELVFIFFIVRDGQFKLVGLFSGLNVT